MKPITVSIRNLLIDKMNTEGIDGSMDSSKFLQYAYAHEDGLIICDRNNTHYYFQVFEMLPSELAEKARIQHEADFKKSHEKNTIAELKKELKSFRPETQSALILKALIKEKSKN